MRRRSRQLKTPTPLAQRSAPAVGHIAWSQVCEQLAWTCRAQVPKKHVIEVLRAAADFIREQTMSQHRNVVFRGLGTFYRATRKAREVAMPPGIPGRVKLPQTASLKLRAERSARQGASVVGRDHA